MRIVFFTLPFAGHATPNIPLFEELSKRKDKILILGSEKYLQEYLDEKNTTFVPYPKYILDVCHMDKNFDLDPEEAAEKYYSAYYDEEKSIGQQYEIFEMNNRFCSDYYDIVKKFDADVVIYDYNAFFVHKIIACLGIKTIELNCNTCEPANIMKSQSFRGFISDIVQSQVDTSLSVDNILIINKKIQRLHKKLFKQYEIKNIEKKYFSYHCPELQDESECINLKNIYLGFNLPETKSCEKDGSIYVSRGTMSDTWGVHTLLKTLQSLGNIDAKIIATLGNNKEAQSIINENTCPSNIEVRLFTDQIKALANASIFVTHGGITGVREALINTTPMIVIPVNFNDYQVGQALENANAGILIKKRPLDKDEIESKVNYMLEHIDEYRRGVEYISEKLRTRWNEFGVKHILSEIK